MNSQNDFIPPPEAPVFDPTSEEFEDPMLYISKIRQVAEKAGICKIRPPPGWQPPFAVDVDTFRFTPRVQRLNELEAKTRIKLNFLDQLAKFWELQGVPLKIPVVDKKCLDLYSMHKAVHDDSGFSIVSKNNKWGKIAFRLGYSDGSSLGSVLQQHYEKILFPYDVFLAKLRDAQDNNSAKEARLRRCKSEDGKQEDLEQCSSKSEAIFNAEELAEKRHLDYSRNSELKKLQFYGAGPKTALPDASVVCTDDQCSTVQQGSKCTRTKTRDKRLMACVDGAQCNTCGASGSYENMLMCDGCDEVCHIDCLILPLTDISKGDWRCPKCIAKECQKPAEVYGFEQARREYTLQTFGQMADKFKIDYFNLPTHMVPCSVVEMEFWRLVNCIEEDVVVEYGADIHSSECGSGFPTERTRHLFPDDDKYIRSGWNLNNIPNLSTSVLRYINVDISGMKVPWCYVGMCFSSFAWHIEDHWSSSINYLHWGEPKTWYGVPGSKAELLEECMKSNASELFEQSPDLLHQLTTIMNPNTLMQCGVPIVRTDQLAGEFVITFPRSYHAGFNQGYNFAEAVNFCSAEWLEMGRLCIEHYRLLKRHCVFSHEELICKMAADTDSLTQTMAVMVHQNLLAMIEGEKSLRKQLHDEGITDAEKEAFELLPDDERQCDYCKTTCFLSAVTCSCSESKLVCIHHSEKLCDCPASQRCLRYRYTLDELLALLHRLRVLLEDFDSWALRAKMILGAKNNEREDISKFKALLHEAEESHFPFCPLRDSLVDVCSEAEKCAAVASQLVSKKACTRQRETGESRYAVKLSRSELEEFLEEIETLPCKIKEEAIVRDLVRKVESFEACVKSATCSDSPDLEKLEKLLDDGVMLDIDLPDLTVLKQTINQLKWLQEVNAVLLGHMTWEKICQLIDAGVNLSTHPSVEEALARLQDVLTASESFDKKAKDCLHAKPKHTLSVVESVIEECNKCPVTLPSVVELSDAVKAYKEWITKYKTVEAPCLSVAESLVAKGHQIPISFPEFNQVESQVSAAKAWRDQTARIFLKKKSQFTLLEVLSPRTDVMSSSPTNKNRRKRGQNCERLNLDALNRDSKDFITSVVEDSKLLEKHSELSGMLDLRSQNRQKAIPEDTSSIHCVCRQKKQGTMVQCQLCNEIFHVKCMLSARHLLQKDVTSSALSFLCPLCFRSQRPSLQSLGSVLVAITELALQLPEGDAFKSLIDRTVSWQEKAQEVLSRKDVAPLLKSGASPTDLLSTNGGLSSGDSARNSSLIQPNGELYNNPSGDSDVCPSAIILQQLEELMIEGDLLEISLEEKEQLRSILNQFHVDYKGMVLVFPECSVDAEDSAAKKVEKVEKRVVREQRKRPIQMVSATETDGSASRSKRTRKLKQQPKVDEAEMNDEEEEICSADICLRPTTSDEIFFQDGEVEWIQCDTCKQWYHFLCVGLKKGEVFSENEEYACKACEAGRNSNSGFLPVIQDVVSIATQGTNSGFTNYAFPVEILFSEPVNNTCQNEVVDISDSDSEDSNSTVSNFRSKQEMDCDVIIVE